MHFQTIFAAGLLQAAAVSAVHYLTPDNAGRNQGANYCGQYAPMDDQFGLKSCSQEDVQLLINSFLATPDAYISIGTSWARAGTAGACKFSPLYFAERHQPLTTSFPSLQVPSASLSFQVS